MRKLTARRFGAHEVTTGKRRGSIHVAPSSYISFIGELSHLEMYLNTRLLPQEPEEAYMARVLLNLQNILEYELELVIAHFVAENSSRRNQAFLESIQTGFVSFKKKFDWVHSKRLLTKREYDIMEEIRKIRNKQTHSHPTLKRIKHKYFDKSLITRAALIALFTDVNNIVLKLRTLSGNSEKWEIIPPGYAEEMGWYVAK